MRSEIITEEYFLLCRFNTSTERVDGGITQYLITEPQPNKICDRRQIRSLIAVLKTDFEYHMKYMPERINVTAKYYALRYGFIKNFNKMRKSKNSDTWTPAPMSDEKIAQFLKKNPVDFKRTTARNCEDHLIVDGYHRAWAMIHRLVHDQSYIPFYQRSYNDK